MQSIVSGQLGHLDGAQHGNQLQDVQNHLRPPSEYYRVLEDCVSPSIKISAHDNVCRKGLGKRDRLPGND